MKVRGAWYVVLLVHTGNGGAGSRFSNSSQSVLPYPRPFGKNTTHAQKKPNVNPPNADARSIVTVVMVLVCRRDGQAF